MEEQEIGKQAQARANIIAARRTRITRAGFEDKAEVFRIVLEFENRLLGNEKLLPTRTRE